MRVVEAINQALHELLERDPMIVVLGEDILDPYGGAFKATKGLAERFPEQVKTTPISEAGIVGVATGLAIRGRPAIVEIMFGDFLCLAMDQLLNHASKLAWVYNDQITVPLIVRTPMGGRRGYGATHSQSLEKHFCGMPGLTVLAVHAYGDPGDVLRAAYAMASPVLVIENKTMYGRGVADVNELPRVERPDIGIIAYGGMVEPAVAAANRLRDEEELDVEVLPLTQISPFPKQRVQELGERTQRVLAVEEGTEGWGFASECARALVNAKVSFDGLAAPAHPIPSSRPWELAILPDADAIFDAALRLYEAD
ncbi:MAG: alpha-ketoacid dehydrogenase subunit beta [Alphaproteobacteria bacterium]|nr:alpha-ketoacid dehydrogenase subunit beta [Alphaproteobacteria bacterium]